MTDVKTIAVNRRARFDYEILDTVEAGLVLTGPEIKAIRAGRVSLREAYGRPSGGELWLIGAHIADYTAGAASGEDPTRPRKLLLHKDQIRGLTAAVAESGLTLVPLRLYIRRHIAKLELGLARGRRRYDKRRAIIDRERDREARAAIGRR